MQNTKSKYIILILNLSYKSLKEYLFAFYFIKGNNIKNIKNIDRTWKNINLLCLYVFTTPKHQGEVTITDHDSECVVLSTMC